MIIRLMKRLKQLKHRYDKQDRRHKENLKKAPKQTKEGTKPRAAPRVEGGKHSQTDRQVEEQVELGRKITKMQKLAGQEFPEDF